MLIKTIRYLQLILLTSITSLLSGTLRAEARFGGGGGHFGGGSSGGWHTFGGHYYPYASNGLTTIVEIAIFLVCLLPFFITGALARADRRSVKLSSSDYQQLRAIFMALQRAWPSNDLLATRGLLTPAFYAKNQAILDGYQDRNVYNRLTDIKIKKLMPVRQTKNQFVMRFNASLRDSFVLISTGKPCDDVGAPIVFKTVPVTHFTEEWTFVKTPTGFQLANIKPLFQFKWPW